MAALTDVVRIQRALEAGDTNKALHLIGQCIEEENDGTA